MSPTVLGVPRKVFLLLALFSVISCTKNTQAPQRGIASQEEGALAQPALAEESGSYSLQDMIHSISVTHSEATKSEILGGFLAATAEEILHSKNLAEVISANADRACVLLGQIHGKKHNHALDFETSEQVGPLFSPGSGQLSHQRALPVSKHQIRKKFCDKVASFGPQEQSFYNSQCLEAGSIEVMPLHFTVLECDNEIESNVDTAQEPTSGRIPLYPNYRGGRGSPTTR